MGAVGPRDGSRVPSQLEPPLGIRRLGKAFAAKDDRPAAFLVAEEILDISSVT